MIWQTRLEKLVRLGAALPEPLNQAFSARPPKRGRWPAQLPSCPAILEFYRICDGGRFGGGVNVYHWLPRRKLAEVTQSLRDWVTDLDPEIADVSLVLASSDVGSVVWHASNGRMTLIASDSAGWWPLTASFEDFVSRLFSPEHAEGEVAAYWAETLRRLDTLD